jgi:hypothetical protein
MHFVAVVCHAQSDQVARLHASCMLKYCPCHCSVSNPRPSVDGVPMQHCGVLVSWHVHLGDPFRQRPLQGSSVHPLSHDNSMSCDALLSNR